MECLSYDFFDRAKGAIAGDASAPPPVIGMFDRTCEDRDVQSCSDLWPTPRSWKPVLLLRRETNKECCGSGHHQHLDNDGDDDDDVGDDDSDDAKNYVGDDDSPS